MNNRRKLIVALGAGALIAIACLGYLIWSGYQEAIRTAEFKTRDYAAIIEARLDATLRRADANMQEIAGRMPLAALNKEAAPRYAREWNSDLTRHLKEFPEIIGIRITDASGERIYTSDSGNPSNTQLGDRDYFRQLRDNPQAELVFSPVLISRSGGRPTVVMARALRDERGVFRGVILTAIEFIYFQKLFQSLNIGAGGNIAVYRRDDFTQVVRWPQIDARLNVPLPPDSPTRAALAGGVKTATIPLISAADGAKRTYSYRVLSAYPFFVSVGVAHNDALAAWRARALAVGLSALTALVLLGGLLYRLINAERAWERAALDALSAGMRMSAIINASMDAIITVDEDERIVVFNAAAEKLFQIAEAGVLGQTIEQFIPERSRGGHHANMRAFAGSGVTVRGMKQFGEVTALRADGTEFPIDASISQVTIGGRRLFTVTMRDITERKEADAVKIRFAAIVENSNEAIYSRALDGTILSWNAGAERMLGYSAAEVIGKSSHALLPPGRLSLHQKNNECLLRGESVANETDRITKGGRRIDVLSSQSPIRDAAGNMIGSSVILQNITERKQMEAALSASEKWFRTMFENMTEGFCVVEMLFDEQGRPEDYRFLEINPVFELQTGLRNAQGKRMRELAPEHEAHWFEIYGKVAVTGESIQFENEAKALHRWFDVSAYRVGEQDSRKVGILFNDITERKRAEASRASLEAQLRESQKMEAIGTLAGGIAHDFNNIIATVLGNAELARQDAINNPAVLESLEEIRKAGAHARDLVQQILSFSRRQPTEKKRIALAPVIEESARLLRATLPARISLDVRCAPDTSPVIADATQIQQIVMNLATNAAHAIQGNGRIETRLDTVMLDAALADSHPQLRALHDQHPGRTVRLVMSDTGSGMDAATLERVFEPFFTTKAVDEGTGLGLSVVHGIVQTHEGAITVESALGKGTTFTIYLPIATATAEAAAPADGAAVIAPALNFDGGKHILYVDDDEALVSLVTRLLERRGFRVSGYSNPREALTALRADPAAFDLVVSDYNMPEMSGLEVARQVRSIRADLPVAVASGFVDEELQTQAAAAGVREVIYKANAVGEFCEIVQRLAQTATEKPKSS